MPNIDKKFENAETILFECECKGGHYFEVIRAKNDSNLSIYFLDRPHRFWHIVKTFWNYRKVYYGDVILTDNDIRELNKVLSNYLKESKKNE